MRSFASRSPKLYHAPFSPMILLNRASVIGRLCAPAMARGVLAFSRIRPLSSIAPLAFRSSPWRSERRTCWPTASCQFGSVPSKTEDSTAPPRNAVVQQAKQAAQAAPGRVRHLWNKYGYVAVVSFMFALSCVPTNHVIVGRRPISGSIWARWAPYICS